MTVTEETLRGANTIKAVIDSCRHNIESYDILLAAKELKLSVHGETEGKTIYLSGASKEIAVNALKEKETARMNEFIAKLESL